MAANCCSFNILHIFQDRYKFLMRQGEDIKRDKKIYFKMFAFAKSENNDI